MCDLYHHTDKKKEQITQQFLCHQKTWEKKDLVHLFLTVQLIKRPNAMIMLAGRFIPSHTHTDKKGVNNITIFMPPENLRKKELVHLFVNVTPWFCLLGASVLHWPDKQDLLAPKRPNAMIMLAGSVLHWPDKQALLAPNQNPNHSALAVSPLSLSLSPSFLSLSNSNFLLQLVQLQSVLATRSVLLLQ